MKITSNYFQSKTILCMKTICPVIVFSLLFYTAPSLSARDLFEVTSGADSGQNSLRTTIAKAKSGDIIHIVVPKIELTSGPLIIRKTMIIRSLLTEGTTITVKKGCKKRIIYVEIPSEVDVLVLRNLKLENGNTVRSGGAICQKGSGRILITDCIISNNHASQTGGGIFNGVKSRIDIRNSHVKANTAYVGGGIFNEGRLGVTGSFSAEKNHTKCGAGGAIFNQGTIEFGNGMFMINENYTGDGRGRLAGGGRGGAIFNRGHISVHAASAWDIINNYTGNGGTDDQSQFVAHGGNGGRGGAIFNEGKIVFSDVAQSNISGNYTGNGGAALVNPWCGATGGNGGSGGAIYNNGGVIEFSNSKCDIVDNHTGEAGKGDSRTPEKGGCCDGQGGYGGAIVLRGNIIVDNNTLLNINDNYVPGNKARGGGIWLSKKSTIIGDILSKKINISNNYRRGPSGEIENVFREGSKKELTSGLSDLEIIKSSEL